MTALGSTPSSAVIALRWDGSALFALDQTALPWREHELELRSAAQVAAAIKRLAIRGAPLIGVAAGYGVVLAAQSEDRGAFEQACESLRSARPTAVNLSWAVERVRAAALAAPPPSRAAAALVEACALHAEEEAASASMAAHGADLLMNHPRLLTHCNTGALAAPGRGTALAVVAELAQRGQVQCVLATESRPLLQGARLTVYELSRLRIPHQLVVDSAAPGLIRSGAIDAVLVGCDRVAANGDVANKVGTYGLALAASAAEVPFVVVGPTSTLDLECPSGAQIEIEERSAEEVLGVLGLPDTPCRNPAFDVTPAALVTALVTEKGTVRHPGEGSLRALATR
jgi:S-methyl-5-thioribose-1-phosphate isomerase